MANTGGFPDYSRSTVSVIDIGTETVVKPFPWQPSRRTWLSPRMAKLTWSAPAFLEKTTADGNSAIFHLIWSRKIANFLVDGTPSGNW